MERKLRVVSTTNVLKELVRKFVGIDNGNCTVCGMHRFYNPHTKELEPCENEDCLTHDIDKVLK